MLLVFSKTFFWLWLTALAITLVVEVPIFVLIGRWCASARTHVPVWRLALAGAAGTCITHPLLWFVWTRMFSDYTTYAVSGELGVAILETFVFYAIARPITLPCAAGASFIANAASYATGKLLYAVGALG